MSLVRAFLRLALGIPMPWRSAVMVVAMLVVLYLEFVLTTALRRLVHRATPGARLLGPLLRLSILLAMLTTTNWALQGPLASSLGKTIDSGSLGPPVRTAREWSGKIASAVIRFAGVTESTTKPEPWPGASATATPRGQSIPKSATQPASRSTVGGTAGSVTYVVQRGDTLNEIAKRFGVTARDIIEANRTQHPGLAENPALLRTGWVLEIPAAE